MSDAGTERGSGRIAAPLLTGAAFLVGPVALLAPLGLAPLLAVVGVGLALEAAVNRAPPLVSRELTLVLALLCAWALSSAAWAVDPAHSFDRGMRLVVESLEGMLLLHAVARLDAAARRRVLDALALGLALMVALFVIDALSGGAVQRALHGVKPPAVSNRGATVLAILMWPALWWLGRTRGPWAAAAGWAAAALGIALSVSASAHVALVLGTIALVVAWLGGRFVARLVLAVVPVVLLVMPAVPFLTPLIPAQLLKPSAQHRLLIWDFADRKIAQRPLFGWGLESSRAIPGGKETTTILNHLGHPTPVEHMSLHPHNGPLQIWLELGAVGALLAAFLVALMLARLAAPDLSRGVRALGLAAFAAAAIEVSLSYGIWQSWWVAALWLAAGFVYLTLREDTAASTA